MEQNIIQDNANQPMPKQKRQISSWIGFVIILIVIIFLFGTVFAWQYYSSQNNNVEIKTAVVAPKQDFSTLNKDVLLHKLFPALTFSSGVANLPSGLVYENLKLYLKNSTENYFVNKQEKNLLLTVQLDGIPHVGGLYHSYLGLFNVSGGLLTPSSSFGGQDLNIGQGGNSYDFYNDKVQFGGDGGQFGFYNCNGIKYILFVSTGWPNSTCGYDTASLFRVSNGNFEKIQIIDGQSLAKINNNSLQIIPIANAAVGPEYGLKMTLSGDKILVKKVPALSDTGCPQTNFKELNWDSNSCIFK